MQQDGTVQGQKSGDEKAWIYIATTYVQYDLRNQEPRMAFEEVISKKCGNKCHRYDSDNKEDVV